MHVGGQEALAATDDRRDDEQLVLVEESRGEHVSRRTEPGSSARSISVRAVVTRDLVFENTISSAARQSDPTSRMTARSSSARPAGTPRGRDTTAAANHSNLVASDEVAMPTGVERDAHIALRHLRVG